MNMIRPVSDLQSNLPEISRLDYEATSIEIYYMLLAAEQEAAVTNVRYSADDARKAVKDAIK